MLVFAACGNGATAVPAAEQAPETAAEPEAIQAPETAAEPEAIQAPETAAEPEAIQAPEMAAEPEATQAPEAAAEPEAIQAPETAAEPEAIQAPEAAAEPEAIQAPETAAEPEAIQAPEMAAEPAAIQAPETVATTTGEEFRFQLVSINRALTTFGLMEVFAKRVSDRTNGQVEIALTSYPDLGISGFDSLQTLQDGSNPFSEIYSGFAGVDFPLLELGEMPGLFPDADTQLRVLKALEEDEARVLQERFNGEIIAYNYYPNQYFFSIRPLNSLEDFQGLRTRTHSVALGDLITGLGAQSQTMAFAEVYTALEQDSLDAGVTGSVPGYEHRWYELTDYVVGPIESRPHTLIAMNTEEWDKLPADFQQIIKE